MSAGTTYTPKNAAWTGKDIMEYFEDCVDTYEFTELTDEQCQKFVDGFYALFMEDLSEEAQSEARGQLAITILEGGGSL